MHVAEREKRILIFGGTFDPPHLAHAKLPPIAAEALGCTRIVYIPAARNPLKTDAAPTSAAHRLAMLRRIVGPLPGANAEIDTLELDRDGPSYTVDTLKIMRARFGEGSKLHLLIGADQALSFDKWRNWPRLLQLAEPAVMPRPPWPREKLIEEFKGRFDAAQVDDWIARIVEVPYMDISATDVRLQLECGGDLTDLLDPAVIEYIQQHHLYGI